MKHLTDTERTDPNWEVARRKGNRVRYQHKVTREMSGWHRSPRVVTPTPVVAVVDDGLRSDDLTAKSMSHLRLIASDWDIKGRSKMSKPELIIAIRGAWAAQGDALGVW